MATFAFAAIGAAASIFGTLKSISAQKKAAAAQRRQQENAARRSNRRAIRAAQIKRAQIVAGAQGAGVGNSSSAVAGAGGIGSELGGALGYSTQQTALSGIISQQQQRAAVWSGVASFGSSLFNAAGGFSAFQKTNNPAAPQSIDLTGAPVL